MQESTDARNLNKRLWTTAALLAAVVVIADQLSKQYIYRMYDWNYIPIIPNILALIHHYNYGIVANIPLSMEAIITLTIIVLIVLVWSLIRSVEKHSRKTSYALALIIGGALGNLIDRVFRDFVFDWILIFDRSAVNLADIAIVLGALLLVINRQPDPINEQHRDAEEIPPAI